MKKILPISLLFIFASATTEFGQFLKLPILIEHFYSHQQKESLSLLEFLKEHYSKDHEDEDKQMDMQLPFKTIVSYPAMFIDFLVQKFEIEKAVSQLPVKHIPLQTSFIPSQLVFQIFRPPRTV